MRLQTVCSICADISAHIIVMLRHEPHKYSISRREYLGIVFSPGLARIDSGIQRLQR
jgi:hypothetical protein